MKDNSNSASGGITFFGLLAIVFITLKLTGVVTWPWVWVLAPLWMPIVVVLVIFGLLVLYVMIKG